VTSKATRAFWTALSRLPKDIQHQASEKYKVWRRDPFHPSLHFKELYDGLWSVRINLQYRALARRREEMIVWFWIGTHEEYERLIENR
jgi:hypothetical protein